MKWISGILIFITASAFVATTACSSESMPCGVCAELHACFDTPGVRINFGNAIQEIDGSVPSFVRHGLSPNSLQPQFEGQASQGICEYLRGVFTMKLSINGTPISPDWFEIGAVSLDDGIGWSPTYYFVFPAGYFDRGIHILQAVFDVPGVSCEIADCPEGTSQWGGWWVDDGKLFIHMEGTITLAVL